MQRLVGVLSQLVGLRSLNLSATSLQSTFPTGVELNPVSFRPSKTSTGLKLRHLRLDSLPHEAPQGWSTCSMLLYELDLGPIRFQLHPHGRGNDGFFETALSTVTGVALPC